MAPPPAEASGSTSAQPLPRDARVIALILASKGIEDTTPQVLHQLLEFAHRYTTDILLDSLTYSEHAGKGGKLDVEDVSLAVQAKVNWSFKEGGERDYLMSMAQSVNSHPLPPVPETPFLRLPNGRDLLTAPNFNLIPNKPPAGYPDPSTSGAFDGSSAHSGSPPPGEGDGSDDDDGEDGDDSNAGTPQPGDGGQNGSAGRGAADDDYDEDDEDMEEMTLEMMAPVPLGGGVAEGLVLGGGGGVGQKREREDEEDDDYDA